MADKANISRVDALEDFRASLITYMEKAGMSLAEVSDEVTRLRVWLLNNQIPHWKTEIRRRTRKLNDAQQELFSAELSSMMDSTTLQKRQVERCEEALREAETKLRATQSWIRSFDSQVEPMARNLERLRNMVGNDLPKAVAYLAQAVKSLDEYAGTARTSAGDTTTTLATSEDAAAAESQVDAPETKEDEQ